LDIVSVSPALGLVSQFGSSAPALVPGQVIEAVVLALLEDGSARLALPGATLDVRSTIPLIAGTSVRLLVKSTSPGLPLVSPESSAQGPAAVAAASGPMPDMVAGEAETVEGQGRNNAMATSAEDQVVNISIQGTDTTTQAALVERPATPQANASGVVANAVRTAAARQGGLAPLMADIEQLVGADAIEAPGAVLKAAAQLLALRLPLQSSLTGADIKQALSQSGLFLEARLALPDTEAGGAPTPNDRPGASSAQSGPSASTTTASSANGASPPSSPPEAASPATDLKAALLVFRQVVRLWAAQVSAAPNVSSTASDEANTSPLAASEPAQPSLPAAGESEPALAGMGVAGASELAEASVMGAGASEPALLSPLVTGVNEPAETSLLMAGPSEPVLASPLVAAAIELQTSLLVAASEPAPEPGDASGSPPAGASLPPPPPPPPPYRGSPPVAQPATPATLASAASLADAAQRLLGATEAALARHTLLQAASLPDRPSADPARIQTQGPQWTFEVPMMTSGGTSIAQFEISRDGRAVTEDGRAIWRARFSVDVEPMGPVHAQVTLLGNRAAVMLWAERPDSAARLRESSALLADAFKQADLEPGDIHCRAGAPAVSRESVPAAGRFLDRAS
jgi:Flagellar hook-length control protein FliK